MPGRLQCLAAIIVVAATAIAARLVHLQLIEREALSAKAIQQRRSIEPILARPGDIVDRHGRLLAVTVLAPSLYIVPNKVHEPREFARRLGSALDIDVERLTDRISRNRDSSFLWVRRRMSGDDDEAVRRLELPRETWGIREEYLRRYPQGVLAAHLLGLRNIDNVGRGGIEEQFDAELRGQNGRRIVLRDAQGRAIDVHDSTTIPPVPGRTIVLTIDAVVQLFADEALDELMADHAPSGACAIVMDVKSSEVLAMASRPGFDPNAPESVVSTAWTNRALAAVYEPGSTFKPLVVAWAIDAGALKSVETIDCENGTYRTGRRVLHDHHSYKELSVTDVLVHSSNIGMAKIGERLGIDSLYECAVNFGFGRPTGIELPGEQSGIVRPPERWNDYSIGSVPMGHEIAVTPLQLITAHAALANGGRMLSPRLVLRDVDPVFADAPASQEIPSSSQVASQVVDVPVARWVVGEAMAEVVRRGTGRAAAIEGVAVFGKSGTAQKFDAEAGTFSHDRHVVSFVAGAPASDPQVIVIVMVDEPTVGGRSGGTVAAPTARSILLRTLQHLGIAGSSSN